jgi:hypothetical protein
MLKRMPRSPSEIGFPELPPPPRPEPKPLPEAALRHAHEPPPLCGSTIGPMWRDSEAARSISRRTA